MSLEAVATEIESPQALLVANEIIGVLGSLSYRETLNTHVLLSDQTSVKPEGVRRAYVVEQLMDLDIVRNDPQIGRNTYGVSESASVRLTDRAWTDHAWSNFLK